MKQHLSEVARLQKLAGIKVEESSFSKDSSINLQSVIYESFARKSTRPFDTVVTYHIVPRIVNEIKKDIVRSLPNNDYFTEEERYVLVEYFKKYDRLLNENIYKYSKTLDEGLKDWLNKGKEKLASVFGSVKDYVSKIWAKIKEVFGKIMAKGKDFVNKSVQALKSKAEPVIKKITDDVKLKKEFIGEIIDLSKIAVWIGKITNLGGKADILSALDSKIVEPAAKKVDSGDGAQGGEESGDQIKESLVRKQFVFNAITTKYIVENRNKALEIIVEAEDEGKEVEKKSDWPDFLTKTGWKENWKKYLFNVFKVVLNPVMGTIGVVGSWTAEKMLNTVSKVIAKLGGPAAREFKVIPEVLFAGMEVSGKYQSAWKAFEDFIKPFLGLIPFEIGSAVMALWHFGHSALFVYAIYEIVKETLDSIGIDINKVAKDTVSTMAKGQSSVAGPKVV
jgi:hypothetical protein